MNHKKIPIFDLVTFMQLVSILNLLPIPEGLEKPEKSFEYYMKQTGNFYQEAEFNF
jgi:hypothetical protein